MELIVIANPDIFKAEIRLINQLFEAGLQIFHLRKPTADRSVYQKILDGILPEHHNRIALHHFHELASDYGIKRIHHTESFRKNGEAHHFTGNNIFSTSIHQIEDIDNIGRYQYSFFGPVFNSISKPDYAGVADADFRLNNSTNTKIIALGGINLNHIDQVKEMNFDGIALLGSIWNEPARALANFKKIHSKCQQY